MEEEKTEVVRMDRSEGVIKACGEEKSDPSFFKTRLCLQPRRTWKPTGDKESECAKKSGPSRLYENELFGVRRFDKFSPITQKEPYKDTQRKLKQAWPHVAEGNGQKVCAITENHSKRPKNTTVKMRG